MPYRKNKFSYSHVIQHIWMACFKMGKLLIILLRLKIKLIMKKLIMKIEFNIED